MIEVFGYDFADADPEELRYGVVLVSLRTCMPTIPLALGRRRKWCADSIPTTRHVKHDYEVITPKATGLRHTTIKTG